MFGFCVGMCFVCTDDEKETKNSTQTQTQFIPIFGSSHQLSRHVLHRLVMTVDAQLQGLHHTLHGILHGIDRPFTSSATR